MNRLNAIALLITGIVLVFIQSYRAGLPRIAGVQLDLLPGLMVYVGIRASTRLIVGLAVLCGLAFDTLSANPLGISILPLFIVGLVLHCWRDLILRDQRYTQIVLGLVAGAAVPTFSLLLLVGTGDGPPVGLLTLWQIFILAATNALFTPVWFWLFGRLDRALNYEVQPESSFRSDREIKRGRL